MTNLQDIDNSWSLFLDRDGVINHRIPGDYIKKWSQFSFVEGANEAIAAFNPIFGTIVVVTNQQGIGKGLMTHLDLWEVHKNMLNEVEGIGGRIDKVYFCADLGSEQPHARKPNPGMAEAAQSDFPRIDFEKSIMIGDSASDMEFGINLGMTTVFVQTKEEDLAKAEKLPIDFRVDSLADFLKLLKNK